MFDEFGNILTYEQFMNLHNFPVPPKEYNTLMRAIPVGLTQLIKSHLKFSKGNSVYPALCLGGVDILDRKCNNRHIRKIFQTKITPRGKFYWGSFITNIN